MIFFMNRMTSHRHITGICDIAFLSVSFFTDLILRDFFKMESVCFIRNMT